MWLVCRWTEPRCPVIGHASGCTTVVVISTCSACIPRHARGGAHIRCNGAPSHPNSPGTPPLKSLKKFQQTGTTNKSADRFFGKTAFHWPGSRWQAPNTLSCPRIPDTPTRGQKKSATDLGNRGGSYLVQTGAVADLMERGEISSPGLRPKAPALALAQGSAPALAQRQDPAQTRPGRGTLGTCEIWNGEIWRREDLAPILKPRLNLVQIPRWWHKNKHRP